MASEPVTYVMDRPITWEQFKAYPDEQKKQYLQILMHRRDASYGEIAEMFGVSACMVGMYGRQVGIALGQRCGGQRTKEHKKQWQAWLDGWRSKKPDEEPEEPVEEVPHENPDEQKQEQTCCMSVSSSTVRLEGKFNIQSVINAISRMQAPDRECVVEIFITAGKA